MSTERQGWFLVLLSAAGYACLPIFAKIGYDGGLEPLQLLTWRFIVAAPTMLALVFLTRQGNWAGIPVLRLFGTGVMFAGIAFMAFFALDMIPASLYTVLLYAYPAFVALLSMLVGERLRPLGWAALGLTLFGVVLTVPELGGNLGQGDESGIDPIGVVLAVSNGATYAIYIVISKHLLRGVKATALPSAIMMSGAMVALLLVALRMGLALPSTTQAWLSIIGIALISTIVPIYTFYAGMQRLGATRASIISTVEPVITLLLSFVLLKEQLTPQQALGGLLILAGAIWVQIQGTTQPVAPSKTEAYSPLAEGVSE